MRQGELEPPMAANCHLQPPSQPDAYRVTTPPALKHESRQHSLENAHSEGARLTIDNHLATALGKPLAPRCRVQKHSGCERPAVIATAMIGAPRAQSGRKTLDTTRRDGNTRQGRRQHQMFANHRRYQSCMQRFPYVVPLTLPRLFCGGTARGRQRPQLARRVQKER